MSLFKTCPIFKERFPNCSLNLLFLQGLELFYFVYKKIRDVACTLC